MHTNWVTAKYCSLFWFLPSTHRALNKCPQAARDAGELYTTTTDAARRSTKAVSALFLLWMWPGITNNVKCTLFFIEFDVSTAPEDQQFYWRGIHKLPEIWENCVATDGHYFEQTILYFPLPHCFSFSRKKKRFHSCW